ncbi:ribonuclease HI [Jongsikchunia kroppenstedtii]|uniref:ribonuclease HI n=1 Tax=Jongsikchunia kroppenstedtii TaxID=1121721 RepID=UPI000374CF1F|nr:ribonuclease HI [Jongsikchunia kroppenstedtii]
MSDAAPEVEIYTDGACLGNPGPGGWGAVLMHPAKETEIYGGEKNTTNNRMELTAAIEALKILKRPVPVRIYTDSSYVRNGVTKWVAGWKANGWRTAAKAPVKNQDLWEQLDELAGQHDIDWQWVKGHAGNEGNERADALAGKGAREAADG